MSYIFNHNIKKVLKLAGGSFLNRSPFGGS